MACRFQVRRGLLAIAITGAFPGLVVGQTDWPRKQTIKLTVPFTPGSATDIVGRILAEKLGPLLGTTVIVENRPGAGGTLGAAGVAKSAPDGYTLLVHSAGHLVNPAIYKNLPYDTLKDFSGVTPLASLPNVLVTAPGRFKDVRELVEAAKARPDALNYASAGNGSATHMNAEVFRHAAGIRAQHVPFKGTPEALTETIAGRVDWFFAPMVSALPLIREKRLNALAVGTAKRSQALPDVPTTVEAGVADSEYLFWLGLFAPAGMSRSDLARLHTEVAKVMASPDVRDRLDKLGAETMSMAPEQFDSFLAAETAKALRIVNAAGIKVD
jgi:tripartite-type tricarboxylate transporter receptor subunit TctC